VWERFGLNLAKVPTIFVTSPWLGKPRQMEPPSSITHLKSSALTALTPHPSKVSSLSGVVSRCGKKDCVIVQKFRHTPQERGFIKKWTKKRDYSTIQLPSIPSYFPPSDSGVYFVRKGGGGNKMLIGVIESEREEILKFYHISTLNLLVIF